MSETERTVGMLNRNPRQNPSEDWMLAGLLLGTKWELKGGEIRTVKTAKVKEESKDGVTGRYPVISFEYGPTYSVEQFRSDIKAGKVNPKRVGSNDIAAVVGHPRFDTEGSEGDAA